MSNNTTKFEFIINEDGSITRNKFAPVKCRDVECSIRPAIMKFHCSSDRMTCGEQVKVFWAVRDANTVSVTIAQGGYSTTEFMPAEGELTLSSNISSEYITITITAKNNSGVVSSRKIIALNKRENTVKTNVVASVVYVIAALFVGLVVILKLLSLIL